MSALTARVLPEVEPVDVPLWRAALRGFSQCAFQADEITGLLFIAAAAVFSLRMAAFYVISVVVATLVARVLRGDRFLLGLGLLGFNAGLMGLALGNFFVPSTALWVAVPVLAAVVAAVTVLFAKVLPFPFLAAPFIGTFWLLYPLAESLGLEKVAFDPFPDADVIPGQAIIAALGATLFASGFLPGLLFLIGLLVASWRHAVVGLIGASIAVALAAYVETPGVAINSGFIAFNAVLAALAAYTVIAPDLRLAVFASILSTWIFSFFNRNWPAPALASGFVLSVWIILALAAINPWFNGSRRDEHQEQDASA